MDKTPFFFVVEDDAVTRLMLSRFLEKMGYEVLPLEDGLQVVEAFKRRLPDIVLMDAKMPVMNGFEACVWIKGRTEGRHIPVLMITGLHDDESVDRAYEAGAVDFITKPIHWAILRNRVKYLWNSIQAERKLYLAASVFENTNEGIVVTDARAIIQSVNPAFSQITGYPSEMAVGKNMNLLKSGRHDAHFYQEMWAVLQHTYKWQGEVWNRRANGEIYPQWLNISAVRSPTGDIVNYVTLFSDLTNIRESEENLLYVTGHDSLTNLPNRLLFHERLNQACLESRSSKELVGVMLLDLDRFKMVNESMGHEVGDRLLVEVSRRLAHSVLERITLARMGGDEFGLVVPKVSNSQELAQIAQSLLDQLLHPFVLDQLELFLGASIGIGLYPLDGEDINTLLKNTEVAMYHAKELGRNNFQFYHQDLNVSSMARMLMEQELRTAVERKEFILHYQPQIDLITGELVGMEALIRWQHPRRGLVSPGEFISLAEETGLIIPMGKWALRSACAQTKKWQDMGYPPLRISVNLSGLQFQQAEFVDVVVRTLAETGLSHQWLELELTESIAMGDVDETYAKLQSLADIRVRLAIDDFGTGFSSLSYLKRFPIDTLKIDQSFICNCTINPEDAAIVRAFIGLARSLNLQVIAEGVETTAQMDFLRREKCNEIQGYYFSRPLPGEQFEALLEKKFQEQQRGAHSV
ncbi:MAG: EAL domain-containing protein [Magnetococcus sp. DMHC-6]